VLDLDGQIPEGVVVETITSFFASKDSEYVTDIDGCCLCFLLTRRGGEWLRASLAIRRAILQLGWHAESGLLLELLSLLPSLLLHMHNAALPERRKRRLLRWMADEGFGKWGEDGYEPEQVTRRNVERPKKPGLLDRVANWFAVAL